MNVDKTRANQGGHNRVGRKVSEMLRRAGHTPPALKVGIDADLLAALGSAIRRTELIRALAMHCSSEGYLERVLTGSWRVDLEGKPAGAVSADDEKHAKAKQAGIRTRREAVMAAAIMQAAASRAQGPSLAPRAEPGPGPKRLSLADLREAARRRREGAP